MYEVSICINRIRFAEIPSYEPYYVAHLVLILVFYNLNAFRSDRELCLACDIHNRTILTTTFDSYHILTRSLFG